MKKIISMTAAVLLVVCIALGLAACKKSSDPAPKPTDNSLNTALPSPDSSTHKETDNGNGVKITPVPVQTQDQGGHDVGPDGRSTYVIKSEDTFENYGFASFEAELDAEYTVVMDNGGSRAEWYIYVLDEKFEDSLRYLPQAYEPVLAESGTLQVKAGQYVYVQCSANSFSAQSPITGATVTFEGLGLPNE